VTKTNSSFPPSFVNKSGVSVIVYGADWCHGCVEFQPLIEEMQRKFGFNLIHIDAGADYKPDYIEYRQSFKNKFIPMMTVFINGKVYYHGTAISNVIELLEFFRDIYGS
jgi:thiol-disulfide isomerase/thioredoxin